MLNLQYLEDINQLVMKNTYSRGNKVCSCRINVDK